MAGRCHHQQLPIIIVLSATIVAGLAAVIGRYFLSRRHTSPSRNDDVEESNNGKPTTTTINEEAPQDGNSSNDSNNVQNATTTTKIDQLFEEAVARVKTNSNRRWKNSLKLALYGLYKQAKEGDSAGTAATSTLFEGAVARAKREAWSKYHGMSKDQAKVGYVALASMLLEGDPNNSSGSRIIVIESATRMNVDVNNILQDASKIREEDDGDDMDFDGFGNGMGVRPSMPTRFDDDYDESDSDNDDETKLRSYPLHSAARRGDAELLQKLLQPSIGQNHDSNTDNHTDRAHDTHQLAVDACDESGQTALHLAADYGHDECVKILLQAGANPNAADLDGISVLQTAVIADRVETAALLLQAGANPDQMDVDGDTPRSCCFDGSSTVEMQQLFSKSATAATPTV